MRLYMIELLGTTLYGKNENTRCKMASTTKIMTAIIVVENTKNLNDKVIISQSKIKYQQILQFYIILY